MDMYKYIYTIYINIYIYYGYSWIIYTTIIDAVHHIMNISILINMYIYIYINTHSDMPYIPITSAPAIQQTLLGLQADMLPL